MKKLRIPYFGMSMIATLVPLAALAGEASSNGGRGGLPDAVDAAAFSQYITNGSLKASLLNYVRTLQVKNMGDGVKETFGRMMRDGALVKDISTPDAYVASLDSCTGARVIRDAMAWTDTGQDQRFNIGGRICFDVPALVKQFKTSGLGIEDAVIKIAALAFHEHVHHFQMESSDPSVIQAQEDEANAVGGYVELTAKVAQVPLLKWSKSVSKRNSACDGGASTCNGDPLAPWRESFGQASTLKLDKLPRDTFCLNDNLTFPFYSNPPTSKVIPTVCFQLDGAAPRAGHMADAKGFIKVEPESWLQAAIRSTKFNALQLEDGDWVSYWQIADQQYPFGDEFVSGYGYGYDSIGKAMKLTFRQSRGFLIVRIEDCPRANQGDSSFREKAYIVLDLKRDVLR